MSAEQNLQYGVRCEHYGHPFSVKWYETEETAREDAKIAKDVLVARTLSEPFVVREPLPDVTGTVVWAKREGVLVIAVLADPSDRMRPWWYSDLLGEEFNWAKADELELIAVVPRPEVES